MAADAASADRRAEARDAARSAAPTVPAGAEKRTRTVSVRLTDAEESAWVAAALVDGHRQTGAWVRERAVAGYLGKVRPKSGGGIAAEAAAEIAELRQEMARWGNNLNQLTRAVNTGAVPEQMAEALGKGWLDRCGRTLARIADRLDALEG